MGGLAATFGSISSWVTDADRNGLQMIENLRFAFLGGWVVVGLSIALLMGRLSPRRSAPFFLGFGVILAILLAVDYPRLLDLVEDMSTVIHQASIAHGFAICAVGASLSILAGVIALATRENSPVVPPRPG